jgi:hypothetical protein
MATIEAKDRQGWLELFADDGIVEDPVGPSPLDPTGSGHRGREAIGRFYDTVIAPAEAIRFRIAETIDCGTECANLGEIHITLGGRTGICRVVSTYRADADGRLQALRAYWEFDKLRFGD